MSIVNRREFLKHSMAATGVLAMPGIRQLSSSVPDTPKELVRRTLGRTGIVLPVVSMGVMRADNPSLVRAAIKAGIVYFDTAHGYMEGKNEEMLGEVLKGYPRKSFVISTKIPYVSTREEFTQTLDTSLKRLQMDSVDILFGHSASTRNAVFDPVMLAALEEAKKTGKTRFIGVSVHKNEPEVIQAVIDARVYDAVLTSLNYRQDHAAQMKEVIAKAADAGIGIIAMKTMAGGFLDKARTKPVNCKAALKWALQNPNVTTAIPGMTAFDQLAQNVAVNTDLTLTEEEARALAMGDAQGGLYCNGCEQCAAGCPRRLPIPELMRAYMYAYGYGSPRLARELVRAHAVPASPCDGCAGCTARCVKGFPLREKISDVARLTDVPEEFLV